MTFKTSQIIRSSEMDQLTALSPKALFSFLQDAAGEHAKQLGFSMETLSELQKTWVLLELTISISKNLPKENETIDIETWPSNLEGIKALREFRLSSKGVLIGEATSKWLVIDKESKRPSRIPKEWTSILNNQSESNLVERLECESIPVDYEVFKILVLPSDIDRNGHISHLRFADWISDSAVKVLGTNIVLEKLSFLFKGEGFANDYLSVRCRRLKDGSLLHTISNTEQDDLVWAASTWRTF